MTEANVASFERRLNFQGEGRSVAVDHDAASVRSVSAYTTASAAVPSSKGMGKGRQTPLSARGPGTPLRSTATPVGSLSARGMSVARPAEGWAGVGDAAYESQPTVQNSLEWAVLDKLAAQMHKQDAVRQRQREVELQNRLREELQKQMVDSKVKEQTEKMRDVQFVNAQKEAYDRWLHEEVERDAAHKDKLRVQKEERELQLAEIQARREEEKSKQKREAQELTERINQDIQAERKRVEDRWVSRREQNQKALQISSQSAKIREDQIREQAEKESRSIREYQRIQALREKQAQEKRDIEEGKRMKRESAGKARAKIERAREQEAIAKAALERQAKDAVDVMREEMNRKRLAEQRRQTQAYLLEQMREKQTVKQAERERLRNLRNDAETDAKEFYRTELVRGQEKRVRNLEHKAELERQIANKMAGPGKSSDVMSEVELRLNKNLLQRVNQALSELAEVDDAASSKSCSVRAQPR